MTSVQLLLILGAMCFVIQIPRKRLTIAGIIFTIAAVVMMALEPLIKYFILKGLQ